MELVLLSTFPIPLRLLAGLAVLITGVLIAFWFFMAKNNPRSRKVDELPSNNEQRKLQDQYDKGEITEEDYRNKRSEADNNSHPRSKNNQ
ncbi:SHOCT domain-containing protein [Planomicrobium sp. Y74]|uniref:SHOCT domain-containing protein n=1 Tax=Planomicrobium sp. Y74 TaxID=2478977 RepID=UPI0013144DB0|nr:SHOCT domain-containing protein [Planomicrobium sp. Y74]